MKKATTRIIPGKLHPNLSHVALCSRSQKCTMYSKKGCGKFQRIYLCIPRAPLRLQRCSVEARKLGRDQHIKPLHALVWPVGSFAIAGVVLYAPKVLHPGVSSAQAPKRSNP